MSTVAEPETKEQKLARWERDGIIVRDCKGCEPLYADPDAMCPRHQGSEYCESGKRPHCTCDLCW